MSKKLHSKLLSVILCIAICCATLCGGLIAANAAAADYNGTYTITVGDDKNAVPFGANEVKAQVKFDLPAGFVAGQFTAKAQSTYTIGDTANVVAITAKDGSALDIADVEVNTKGINGGNDKTVRFIIADGMGALATSITIEYTLEIDVDTNSNYVSNGTTAQYPVAIDFTEDDLASFALKELQSVKFNKTADSDTWFHSHSAWYSIRNLELNEGKDGKHNVTTNNARCHLCTHTSGLHLPVEENTITQVLPDYTEFDGVNTPLITQEKIDSAIADSNNDGGPITAWIGVSGVTVRYNENGALDVDVHVFSRWRTGNNDKVVLLICDKDGNELYRLGPVADGSSYLANNGFPSTEKLFTITGLSAKNLETELLLTAVEYSTGKLEISRTMPFCLADWCENVVTGNSAVWADGATNAQIEADKDVAAALYYYGASIDPNVFDKNTSAGTGSGSTSTIPAPEYINKTTVTWDGEYRSDYPVSGNYDTRTDADKLANFNAFEATTEGSGNSADDPYIIDTIEEFIYVSQLMGTYSQNKFFKVADTVAQFDFGTWGDGKPKSVSLIDNSSHFYGTFDGNGVEFINMVANGWHMSLFPNTNAGAVIKNVKLTGATITALHNAAAIIANANGGTSTIDGCVVTDCNVSGADYVGVLAGVVGSGNSLVVNNCFVSNNTATTTNTSYRSNHIIGAGGWNGGTLTVNNSIVLVNDAYAWNITCTNVYADEADNTVGVVVTGAGAVDAMGLGSAWFDTDSYPELKAYHTFGVAYVDEATHKTICLHKINGTVCNVNLGNEGHTLVPNADGSLNVCECGYSEKAVSGIEYIDVNYDEWDGTQVEPTKKDSNGNILITTAEELAWIALRGDAATAGKSYKVADGIGAFYLTPNGAASYDNSSYDRLKETLTASTDLKGSTLNKWVCKSYVQALGGWASFQGSFDGNGITIYGMPGQSTNSGSNGLFPYIKGDVSFKNFKITDSYISSNNNVGAIFGSTFNSANNLNSISVENCIVVGNYLHQTTAGTANGWCNIGGLGGSIGVVSSSILVNNCAIVDNHVDNASAVNNMKTRAFFGNFLNYDTTVVTVSIKNSFTDLNTYANGYYPNNNANYSNIYTTCNDKADYYSGHDVTVLSSTADMQGINALETMKLDKNVWVASSNNYPEFLSFHSLKTISVDDEKHETVCLHKINGVLCDFTVGAAEHTLLPNADGTLNVCECGYSKEIIGNKLTPNNKTIAYWNGAYYANRPSTLADSGIKGSGSEGDPYIIKTAAQLYYVTQYAGAESAGKFYEVDDSIAVFDLSADTSGWNLANNSAHFQGHFDGNGVEIRGLNFGANGTHNAALFPNVNGTATIKNIKISGANVKTTLKGGNAAALVANINGDATTNIIISNCAVINSVVNSANAAGALVGTAGSGPHLTIKDCIVYGTTTTTSSTETFYYNNCLLGLSWTTGNCSISDSIVVGLNYTKYISNVSNVYTSTDVAADKLGDAWFDTATGIPELKVFHDIVTLYVDENTHKTVCQDFVNGVQCDVCGINAEHNLVLNAAGTEKECACGISEEVVGNVVKPNNANYDEWNGDFIPPTKTDANNNIIIETAEEMAWVALRGGSETSGKNYKVIDNAVFNMNGAIGITVNSTATDVKNATKNAVTYEWNYDGNYKFMGNFDGNGVIIYNIRNKKLGYAGLFPHVNSETTIENVTVRASYFVAFHYSSAIVGTGEAQKDLNLDKCVVENCYINDGGDQNAAATRAAAVFVGSTGNSDVNISNCLGVNNICSAAGYEAGFIAKSGDYINKGITITNSISIGITPYSTAKLGGALGKGLTSQLTVSNVYTDVDCSLAGVTKAVPTADQLGDAWFDTATGIPELKVFHDLATIYIDENTHQVVCQIFVNGEQCSVCQAVSSHKTVNNAEGTYAECECGYGYEIKGIHAMDIPKAILDRITTNSIYIEKFETNDTFKAAYSADVKGLDTTYDEFDMYTTSLSLKVSNPHIGFMFAFSDAYKANRGNITVTFNVDGVPYVTEPVETDGILGTNWVNNKGAGRYHLYRFKQLPVTKLCKDITVTVNYNGSNYDFGTYSAAGYAINAMNAGPDYQEHVNAAMALVYYSEMLAARANV